MLHARVSCRCPTCRWRRPKAAQSCPVTLWRGAAPHPLLQCQGSTSCCICPAHACRRLWACLGSGAKSTAVSKGRGIGGKSASRSHTRAAYSRISQQLHLHWPVACLWKVEAPCDCCQTVQCPHFVNIHVHLSLGSTTPPWLLDNRQGDSLPSGPLTLTMLSSLLAASSSLVGSQRTMLTCSRHTQTHKLNSRPCQHVGEAA